MVPVSHYIVLSLALFAIGAIGVLTRRNAIIVLMSLELMFNAANINLVVFSNQLQELTGQVFAVFVITIAAAEAAVALASARGDVVREAKAWLEWGYALLEQGQHDEARHRLARALGFAEGSGLPGLRATCLKALALWEGGGV